MSNFQSQEMNGLTAAATNAGVPFDRSKGPHDMLPSSVGNMTFLIQKLSEECTATQFLREFTQNGVDAVAKLPGRSGEITWDIDWTLLEATRQRKLACIDTGIGMNGPEMVNLLPQWFHSGQVQSSTGNFGVGGKVSAMTRNHEGITYQSWKNGHGAMVHLRFDPVARVYGLMRWENNGGEFWTPLSDEFKPPEISAHGTKVTFHGNSPDEDTVEGPKGVSAPARWIARNLNTRFFELPTGVSVRAREGWQYAREETRHNFLRQVEGQKSWLDRHTQSKGILALEGATAHWWILQEGASNGSEVAAGGHTAVLFQNELYEMASGRAGIARLQSFGAVFGAERVVIYVEPHEHRGVQPAANAARTQIKSNGENLNWTAWAAQFREKMPSELISLQHEIGNRTGGRNYKDAIAARLKQAVDLFGLRRLCQIASGTIGVRDADAGEWGEDSCAHADTDVPASVIVRPAPKDTYSTVTRYLRKLVPRGTRPARSEKQFRTPTVHWVSTTNATRSMGDMDHRAAKFIPESDMLLINMDFQVFTSMLDRWQSTYAHVHGSEKVVQEVVQEWFEQQLLEVILGAKALSASDNWSSPEMEELWNESALSAAVLPRWHIDSSIGRNLAHRFGSSSKDT